MAYMDVSGLVLDDARLEEIRGLLRYESSISFTSYRAAESMLLLLATVERYRPHMINASVGVASFYTVRCAACPTPVGDENEAPLLWRDRDEATRMMAEWCDPTVDPDPYSRWRQRSDGTYICGPCGTKQDCAGAGHQWGPWTACTCADTVTEHVEAGGQAPTTRWCQHCREQERGEPAPCVAPAQSLVWT